MQVGAGHAGGVIETVGEPPTSVPAGAAVRVGGHIEVEIESGEESVVEFEESGVVAHAIEFLVDD